MRKITVGLLCSLGGGVLLQGCADEGNTKQSPNPQPPSAPAAAPVVTVAGNQVTATFTGEAGYAYYVHYGQNDAVHGSFGPFDASPAEFELSAGTGMWQFSLSRKRDGLESERGPADQAPTLDPPTVSLMAERGAENVLMVANPELATVTAAYWTFDGTPSLTGATLIGEVTDPLDNELTHTITEFFSEDLTPRTYYYFAQARYQVGEVVKSTSTLAVAYDSSTPDLARFRVHTADAATWTLSAADDSDPSVYVSHDTIYWICGSTGGDICAVALADAGQVSEPAHTATSLAFNSNTLDAFLPEMDATAFYFVYGTDSGHNLARYTVANQSEQVLLARAGAAAEQDWLAMAHDATHLYLSTATEILQVSKATLVENSTPFTTLLTLAEEPTHMTLVGERLFYADSTGLNFLTVPDGTTPTLVSAQQGNIAAIAATGDQVFFIADSETAPTTQALYGIDLGAETPEVVLLHDWLFAAHSLAYNQGRLSWADKSKVYSVTTAGEEALAHLTTTSRTVEAAGDDGLVLVHPTSSYLYKVPTARSFAPLPTPSAPATLTVDGQDTQLRIEWSTAEGADSYLLTVDAVHQPAYFNSTNGFRIHLRGFVNGDTYPVEVRSANLNGVSSPTTTNAMPQIAKPGLLVDPGDDRMVLRVSLPRVIDADSQPIHRIVRFSLYRDSTTSVDVSGTPIAEVNVESDEYGYIHADIEDLAPSNDNTFWFYNAMVSDVALVDAMDNQTPNANPTTSDAAFVAGAEPYANAASALSLVVDIPAVGDQQRKSLSWANNTLYWVSYDSYGSPQWQGFYYDGTPTRAAFTVLNNWEALTSDGTLLYAVKPGEIAVIDPSVGSPVATTLMTSSNHADFAGTVTNFIYHHDGTTGWLIASVADQAIIKVETDGSGATTLHASTPKPPMGQLAARDGWVYWSEQYQLKRIHLDGSDTDPEVVVSDAGGDIRDVAVSSTHVYYTVWNNLHRVLLDGTASEDLGKGVAVAVDAAADRPYWDANDIFTLDDFGRVLTVATRLPFDLQDYRRIRILNGQVYTYSGNEIEAVSLLP